MSPPEEDSENSLRSWKIKIQDMAIIRYPDSRDRCRGRCMADVVVSLLGLSTSSKMSNLYLSSSSPIDNTDFRFRLSVTTINPMETSSSPPQAA